jgi:hypothetical protein
LKLLLIVVVGVSAYFIWDGTYSRRLNDGPEEIQAMAKLTTMGDVALENLVGHPSGSSWDSKVFTVGITNQSDRIVRGLHARFYLKSKAHSDVGLFASCLREGEKDFRILARTQKEKQCVVFLTKEAADFISSSDFDSWSWSYELYGHSQPIRLLVFISSWFNHVNE